MGANEKHAATYHGREYTPNTGQVRESWRRGRLWQTGSVVESKAEFDRWLETVRAEAKAEAWDEGLQEGLQGGWEDNPYKETP